MAEIKTEKGVYLIRGTGVTAQDLRDRYESFQKKFGSKLSFDEWLVQRGGVYKKVKESVTQFVDTLLKEDEEKPYQSPWCKDGGTHHKYLRTATNTVCKDCGDKKFCSPGKHEWGFAGTYGHTQKGSSYSLLKCRNCPKSKKDINWGPEGSPNR